MMLIYVVNMLLMKANNHGFYLLNFFKFIGIQDKIRFLKFHKFTKTCKQLLHEKYVKN
jgi:hypothetical protein